MTRVDTSVWMGPAARAVVHACRGRGRPIRSLNDCLIAAVALRSGVGIAHRDADFAYIAAATGVLASDLRTDGHD